MIKRLIAGLCLFHCCIAVGQNTTVTVTRGTVPASGVLVYSFAPEGTSYGIIRTSDANGVATFTFAADTQVKFRIAEEGRYYWSEVVTAPATVAVTLPSQATSVTVTLGGTPVAGRNVRLYSADEVYLNYSRNTDTSGVARFSIPDEELVKFRVTDDAGAYRWSEVVAAPAPAAIEMGVQTTATVTRGTSPAAGVSVYSYAPDGTSYGIIRTTDAQGVARFPFDANVQVKFRVAEEGRYHWSEVITSPANATVLLPSEFTAVTVTCGGTPVPDLSVLLCAADGTSLNYSRTTGANGIALFSIPDGDQVCFRATDAAGVDRWSAVVFAPAPAAIELPADTTVTVLRGTVPAQGLLVYSYAPDGSSLGQIEGTDANGVATFVFTPGLEAKFRVSEEGRY